MGGPLPHSLHKDGLPSDGVWSIFQDGDGYLWFGTPSGVSRYDGKTFTTFTTEDGLMDNKVQSIFQDREGQLWFGTRRGGVSRYDGKTFTTFTTEDGLGNNYVWSILQDGEARLWFATGGGVSRYDGQKFTTFTTEDGLAGNGVYSMFQDGEGYLWFGTGGGVSRYDGQVFQTLTRQDGLAGDVGFGATGAILQDGEGQLWFGGATKGVTRYRPPPPSPPSVSIDALVAGERYGNPQDLTITSNTRLITFEFRGGMSFKTRPEGMVYRYRLNGHEVDWNTTHARRVEYADVPKGNYRFEVQAVDRDLVYSEPDRVTLKVTPPWYLNGWIVFPSGGAILALLISSIIFGTRYALQRRESQRLRDQMLVQEREAHEQEAQARKEIEAKAGELAESNRQLEVAKDAAEAANRAKSVFLANMSHEIRTPMNAVLGYTGVLMRSQDLPAEHRHSVEIINNSGNHLLALINDVLDLSRIESGRIELQENDFDLVALVNDLSVMFSLRCEEEGLGWRVEWAQADTENQPIRNLQSRWVHGDESKLRQVLINLLGNAVKFTEEGEVVLRIHARTEADDPAPKDDTNPRPLASSLPRSLAPLPTPSRSSTPAKASARKSTPKSSSRFSKVPGERKKVGPDSACRFLKDRLNRWAAISRSNPNQELDLAFSSPSPSHPLPAL